MASLVSTNGEVLLCVIVMNTAVSTRRLAMIGMLNIINITSLKQRLVKISEF